jgi:periplasmic protein TonB
MQVVPTLIGLVLYLVPVHAQQTSAAPYIPPGQAARLISSNSTPVYPPKAKAAGIEGTVVVLAQINKSGRVDLLRVVSGPELLRQAALDAVRSWVYRPHLIDGSPTGFRTEIKVRFAIEKQSTKPSPHN